MDYKKEFCTQLENAFMGNKMQNIRTNQAKSGFVNLLSIKAKYFERIKSYLDENINSQDSYEQKEIYNKLYDFFGSYLNATGTPFFYDTPDFKKLYARVYSNTKDTSLFYKTQDLYYVKSDKIYESFSIKSDDEKYEFYFDTNDFIQNADNTKRKVIFKLYSLNDELLTIKVLNDKDLFPDLNNIYKANSSEFSDDFLKTLKTNGIKITGEELKKIFNAYKKQNEIDFFIHKNAKAFLEEQFDLWMFKHLYSDSAFHKWESTAIERLQKVRNFAFDLIKFISDFENELKAIWLKPKFAKKVNFVFSLEIILSKANNAKFVLESLIKDENFNLQIKEWQELNLIDESFDFDDFKKSLCHCEQSEAIHTKDFEKYQFLPLDTKYLSKENYYLLLGSFENLDFLNGELVKADNFQALQTLLPKYQNKIDLIYIDPPYNTGNDGFIYADNFNHSSWLAMLSNRLELAKEFLKQSGSIFVSIDDNEQANLKLLMDSIFGEENFIGDFIRKTKSATNDAKIGINIQHENCLSYAKNKENILFLSDEKDLSNYKNPDNDPNGAWIATDPSAKSGTMKNGYFGVTNPYTGKIDYPPQGRFWLFSQNTIQNHIDNGRICFKKEHKENERGFIYKRYLKDLKTTLKTFDTLEFASKEYMNQVATKETNELNINEKFDNPKPEKLLKRIIEIATNSRHVERSETSINVESKDTSPKAQYDNATPIVMDFFAGSGTTLATALKLNRKFVGVEMGEHFYKVILPRLKKVISGFQSGISKDTNYKGGGAFCYYKLETYEQALDNCEYTLQNGIFDYRKSRKLIKTLNKNEKVCLDMSDEYYSNFEPFMSVSNLLGLNIKHLFIDENGLESCEFENGEIIDINSLDLAKYDKLKNLIWWE